MSDSVYSVTRSMLPFLWIQRAADRKKEKSEKNIIKAVQSL